MDVMLRSGLHQDEFKRCPNHARAIGQPIKIVERSHCEKKGRAPSKCTSHCSKRFRENHWWAPTLDLRQSNLQRSERGWCPSIGFLAKVYSFFRDTFQRSTNMPKLATESEIQNRLAKLQGAEWESDSSDDETDDLIKVGQLPSADGSADAPTDDTAMEALLQKAAAAQHATKSRKKDQHHEELSRVVYLGRVPHGFYEKEMEGFFGQFGKVQQLRLSRNKKTGNSKHYAFVEFEDAEVAQVVAETMNGYRLFDHILQCKVVSADKIHPKMFHGANKTFKVFPWKQLAREQHNAVKTAEQTSRIADRLLRKEQAKRRKMAQIGMTYEFSGYAGCVPEKSTHIKFE